MATLLGNCTEKGTETLMEGSSTEVNTAVDATGEFRASQVELVGRTLGKVRVKDRGLGSPPPNGLRRDAAVQGECLCVRLSPQKGPKDLGTGAARVLHLQRLRAANGGVKDLWRGQGGGEEREGARFCT